ncbi:hypothetical protein KKF64_01530 [Patescibacteria group bacterium]|nr:hypothetical protein [Patescibacteria group bacterium]
MNAKVVCDHSGIYKVMLKQGGSFSVNKEDLPASLHSGGDAELALIAAGENTDSDIAIELVNYLLKIE